MFYNHFEFALSLSCKSNIDMLGSFLISGCRAWLSDDSMKLLDLFKKGKAILSINSDKVESVRIFTINGMEDAFQINFELLEDQQKVEIKVNFFLYNMVCTFHIYPSSPTTLMGLVVKLL